MSIKQNLWLSDPCRLQEFLAAETEEMQFSILTPVTPSADMSNYGWMLVGTAESELTFSTDSLNEKALVATDLAIAELTKNFQSKLEVLEGFKSTLLCLEAPAVDGESQ